MKKRRQKEFRLTDEVDYFRTADRPEVLWVKE